MDTNESTTPFIAGEVKRLRKLRGMTQGQLATAMTSHGVAWKRSTVVNVERCSREQVTVNEIFALAEALGVSPQDLLPTSRAQPAIDARERLLEIVNRARRVLEEA